MKNKLTTTLLGLMLLSSFLSDAQVSTIGLVGDYSFSGNANDNSGLGNNGIVWGATLATGKSGQPNSAYHFDGSTNYIEVPNAPSLNLTSNMTLNIVFQLETFTNNPCQSNTLIQKWSSLNSGGYCFQISDNGLDFDCNAIDTNLDVLYCIIGSSSSNVNLNYGHFIHSNTWYCATYTYSLGIEKIYIDGALVNSHSISTLTGTNAQSLFFGLNTLGIPAFNGIIDDIKIYNRALSDAEVAALCSSTNTSVAENSSSNFILSPNPSTNGLFQLKSDSQIGKYNCEIFNSMGQLLQNKQFSGLDNSIIDLSNEANGVYILKIKTGTDTLIRKLLKN